MKNDFLSLSHRHQQSRNYIDRQSNIENCPILKEPRPKNQRKYQLNGDERE
jgi:hypothetical protein